MAAVTLPARNESTLVCKIRGGKKNPVAKKFYCNLSWWTVKW